MSKKESITISPLSFTYTDKKVRMFIDRTGNPCWVARDCAEILGIVKIRTTLAGFPDDEKGVERFYTPGGTQTLTTLNLPGLFRMIFQSRKDEAEAFKRWVFHDVLDSIWKTGTYTIEAVEEKGVSTRNPLAKKDAHTMGILEVSAPLPPPERSHKKQTLISKQLLSVWRVLRNADEPMCNAEIARRADVAMRTTSLHTKYLTEIKLLRRFETFPRTLFEIDPQAQTARAAYWNRLEYITQVVEARSRLE